MTIYTLRCITPHIDYSLRFHGQAMWRSKLATSDLLSHSPFGSAPQARSPEWEVVSSFVSFVQWPAANRLITGDSDALEKLNRTGRNSQTFFPSCFALHAKHPIRFFLWILTWPVRRNAIYNFISGDLLNCGEI